MSQTALAQKVGTNQQTIQKIENGKIKYSRFFPAIAREFGLTIDALVGTPPVQKNETKTAAPALPGEDKIPVRTTAYHGWGTFTVGQDTAEDVVRPQPLASVRGGYGLIVVDDSMSPEFEIGHVALVHPHLPPRPGDTCVFYTTVAGGVTMATIKRLRRITDEAWYVRQWNVPAGTAKDTVLKRSEWTQCHVTVGRYSRR